MRLSEHGFLRAHLGHPKGSPGLRKAELGYKNYDDRLGWKAVSSART